ncbi:hypothetical protein F4777DRAFT_573649 [Nemania sp. FL0916]|nr:hypothetical protein F4777DRAFT_573649 [Nemania sp. FL0916]
MARKVRLLQIQLKAEPDADHKDPVHTHRGQTQNPFLSQWAVLVGKNDLLLEIFPIQGPNIFETRNQLRVSRSVDLAARRNWYKHGIFPQSDTDKSDEEIIEIATEIIRHNPVYNLVEYNCQTFVNELAEKIAIPNFTTQAKKAIRTWPPRAKPRARLYSKWVIEKIPPEQQAHAEIEYLAEYGEKLRLDDHAAAEGLEYITPDAHPDAKPDGSAELKPFSLRDQRYYQIDEGDDLSESRDGIVYGLWEDPGYPLTGIPECTGPWGPPPDWHDVEYDKAVVFLALVPVMHLAELLRSDARVQLLTLRYALQEDADVVVAVDATVQAGHVHVGFFLEHPQTDR